MLSITAQWCASRGVAESAAAPLSEWLRRWTGGHAAMVASIGLFLDTVVAELRVPSEERYLLALANVFVDGRLFDFLSSPSRRTAFTQATSHRTFNIAQTHILKALHIAVIARASSISGSGADVEAQDVLVDAGVLGYSNSSTLDFVSPMSATRQFVYATTCGARVGDVLADVVRVHNAVARAQLSADALDRLCAAPGAPLAPHLRELLSRCASEARAAVGPAQAERRAPLGVEGAQAALSALREAVRAAFGAGGAPREVAELLGEGEGEGPLLERVEVDGARAALFFASRELARERTLAECIGANENTKVVVRLGTSGCGAPPRDPEETAQETREALAYMHRKQEEERRLATQDAEPSADDTYLGSAWADPSGLKKQITGLSDIKWRPF
eukprot:m51a1_g1913 putative upf0769 protein c21orf59 homolog (390) ;mRNA; r:814168-816226